MAEYKERGTSENQSNSSAQNHNTQNNEQEQDHAQEEKQAKNSAESFAAMLASLFGQSVEDCFFTLQNRQCNWALKLNFIKNEGKKIIAGLNLADPFKPVEYIKIGAKSVFAPLDQINDPNQKFVTALAMASAAMANKSMREKSVDLHGSDEDKLFLLMAANLLGLKVNNASPQLQQQATGLLQGANPQFLPVEIFKGFIGQIEGLSTEQTAQKNEEPQPEEKTHERTAKPENSEPQTEKPQPEAKTEQEPKPEATLRSAFKRAIAQPIKDELNKANISEKTYKQFTETLMKTQDARKDTLKNTLQKQFNLNGNQLNNIIKIMDQEGITSWKPGQARQVNYDRTGRQKQASAMSSQGHTVH